MPTSARWLPEPPSRPSGSRTPRQLLQVSPTDTALELGQTTGAQFPGAPQSFFESWSTNGRTFGRVVPTSAQEAKVLVAKMKIRWGPRACSSRTTAATTAGPSPRRWEEPMLCALAQGERVAVGAGAMFYGAQSPGGGTQNSSTRAARTAPQALLFGSSSLDSATVPRGAVTGRQAPVRVGARGPDGQRTRSRRAGGSCRRSQRQSATSRASQAIFGYAAMSAVLHVPRPGRDHGQQPADCGPRFHRKLKMTSSVLGPFTIDSSGNTSLDSFVINHVP